ncbi:hypothetical protein GH714_003760 [Hevea brasiliensis]|uniref:DOG1 domain-containing protein n=1 Tax=Hevea brasiliensis TaxID=3981 RepID=A0A6A6M7D2_HEVBR|nr:hypothetical protein GH714_003760 [Hevea brasiliensis]
MKTKVEEKFSQFLEKWICQLDEYLQQLRRVSKDYRSKTAWCDTEQELQALVSKVTQHYKDYYTIKWALAHEDVLAFFCPIWVSPLEYAYSWITGWKPSAIFKLVDSIRTSRVPGSDLAELTQEQQRKIEALRVKIRLEEEKVEREMERQQVAVAEEDGGVGKVGGSSEEWGASEPSGGNGAGSIEGNINGRTREDRKEFYI